MIWSVPLVFIAFLSWTSAQEVPIDPFSIGKEKQTDLVINFYNDAMTIENHLEEEIIVISDSEKGQFKIREILNLENLLGEKYAGLRFRDLLTRKGRKSFFKRVGEDIDPYKKDIRDQLIDIINQIPLGLAHSIRTGELMRNYIASYTSAVSLSKINRDVEKLHSDIGKEIPHWEKTSFIYTPRMNGNFLTQVGLPLFGARVRGSVSMDIIRPGKKDLAKQKIKPLPIVGTRLGEFYHAFKTFKMPLKGKKFVEQFPDLGSEVIFKNSGRFVLSVGGDLLQFLNPLLMATFGMFYTDGEVERRIKNVSFDKEHPAVELTYHIKRMAGGRTEIGPAIGTQFGMEKITQKMADFAVDILARLNLDIAEMLEGIDQTSNNILDSRAQLKFLTLGGHRGRNEEIVIRYLFDLRYPEAEEAFQLAFRGHLMGSDTLHDLFNRKGLYRGVERTFLRQRNVESRSRWIDMGFNAIEVISIDTPNLNYNWNDAMDFSLFKFGLKRERYKILGTNEEYGLQERTYTTILKRIKAASNIFRIVQDGKSGKHNAIAVVHNIGAEQADEFKLVTSVAMARAKPRFQRAFYNLAIRSFNHLDQRLGILAHEYLHKEACYKRPRVELGHYFDENSLRLISGFSEQSLRGLLKKFLLGSHLTTLEDLLATLQADTKIQKKEYQALKKYIEETHEILEGASFNGFAVRMSRINTILQEEASKDRAEKLRKQLSAIMRNHHDYQLFSVLFGQYLFWLKKNRPEEFDMYPFRVFLNFESEGKTCRFNWVFEGTNIFNQIQEEPALQSEEQFRFNDITIAY